MNKTNRVILALAVVLTLASGAGWAQAHWSSAATTATLGPGFTYQGQLNDANGDPVNDACNFRFNLWGSESGADQIGSDATTPDIAVENGAFTALVNAGGEFGTAAFNGHPRWLGIAVRCSGAADYTPLTPRQALTPAPYAQYAATAGSAPQRNIAAPSPNSVTVLDSVGDVGAYPAVAIGVDGLPIVVYVDTTNHAVKTAHCEDPQCLSATFHTLDSDTQSYPLSPGITIGADGLPLIAYHLGIGQTLKVAHCTDVACAGATIRTLTGTNTEQVGDLTLLIGRDGLGLIVFHKSILTNENQLLTYLMVAHCADMACSNNEINTIDTDSVGLRIAAAIKGNGLPMITYAAGNGELRVTQCNDPACISAEEPVTKSLGGPAAPAIATESGGLGSVVYYHHSDRAIQISSCFKYGNAIGCIARAAVREINASYPKVTYGADGLALLVYRTDNTLGFSVAHCDTESNECAYASNNVIPFETALLVNYLTVTTGADGLPLIVYQDSSNNDLKVMHCSNAFCAPYYRQP